MSLAIQKAEIAILPRGITKAAEVLVVANLNGGLHQSATSESQGEVEDQLRIILREMGEEGNHLSVEKQVMLSFHGRGQHLPPWEDGASRRSRRVSLVFHPSYSHRRASEGGALRLHTVKDKSQGKNMVEVPGGGANWAIFRTPDVRQEVTKVNLPCGRWCITVCAEDAEVARKLRPDQGVLSCAGETTMESHAASREAVSANAVTPRTGQQNAITGSKAAAIA